jgi:hypothetical protein
VTYSGVSEARLINKLDLRKMSAMTAIVAEYHDIQCWFGLFDEAVAGQ